MGTGGDAVTVRLTFDRAMDDSITTIADSGNNFVTGAANVASGAVAWSQDKTQATITLGTAVTGAATVGSATISCGTSVVTAEGAAVDASADTVTLNYTGDSAPFAVTASIS